VKGARGVPGGRPPTRAELRILRGLKRRKFREAERLFAAEGVRVVEELLDSGIDLVFALGSPSLEDTARGRALAARLAAAGVLRRTDDATLAAHADTESPQGVIAVARIPDHSLAALEVRGPAVALVLDGVQDPGNLGTLLRTAEAFAALFAAALPGTADPWNAKSVRAAAGALFRLPTVRTSADELLEWLDRHGFTLYGSDPRGTPADAIEPAQRAALAVGNEGAGLSPRIREAAAVTLAVPIRGRAESLNVAVAAGILLYVLTRTR